jgi:hypothetical protein
MRFITYLIATGIVGAIFVAIGVWLAGLGFSNPNESGFAGVGILFIVVVAIGYPIQYVILRAQLDRHEGSIPMPGILGALVDIDDDDVADDSDDDWSPAYPAESDEALDGDEGGTEVLSTCPNCGLRELRPPGAPCRVCGHRFPTNLGPSAPARPSP